MVGAKPAELLRQRGWRAKGPVVYNCIHRGYELLYVRGAVVDWQTSSSEGVIHLLRNIILGYAVLYGNAVLVPATRKIRKRVISWE